MKLFLDIGNSRVKWGAWDGERWQAEGSVDSEAAGSVDWLSGLPRPEAIAIAAVGAEARVASMVEACERVFDVTPRRMYAQAVTCGVRCAYTEPARLGVDRWLALVAGFRRARGAPAIVFDCGTAITVDAATAGGEHLGGLIVPGLALMRRALYGSTAGIPDEGDGDVGLLARDTRSAVTGGTLYAAVAFMQHVAAELRTNLGDDARCFLTGGDAERLQPLLSGDFDWQPRLVLEGMVAMMKEQSCESS